SPSHPAVREALEAMKGLLLDPSFGPRACPRRGPREGVLFVFLQRFADGRGEAVEERLEPVFVAPDGSASREPERDRAALWDGDGAGAPCAAPSWAARDWEALLGAARREERRRRRARAAELERAAADRARARMGSVAARRRGIVSDLESAAAAPPPAGLALFAPLYAEDAARKAREEVRRAEADLEAELEALDASAWVEAAEADAIGAWILVAP
ncbi:MAG: hypothetical protein MUC63_03495, partial [Planctomycetes bacterium]|nr:hypothetical protein [Planctomycetota bacterium]